MFKTKKFVSFIFSLFVLLAIVSTLLMLHYRSTRLSDLWYSLSQSQWQIDSTFVHRSLAIFGPDERLGLDHADSAWILQGAIFGHNNLHEFLNIQAIQIQDSDGHFKAEAPMWYLCPPTQAVRRNPHYFLNEPFGIVYNLQWANTNMGQQEFNHFVQRAFDDSSLYITIRTNRGDLFTKPHGYRTINSAELVREYPVPKQVF